MTEFKRSIFVIPSTSLEDLPKRMGHETGLDFLNAWTAQWDPRLLASLGTLPEWKRADGNALDLEDSLVVCPKISRSKLEQPLRERLEFGRCVVIDSMGMPRSELASTMISATCHDSGEGKVAGSVSSHGEPLLLEDFYALGYAVLQIQILAKKLRYSWNIDWIMFTEQTLSAARASIANDAEEAERWLQACFDSLSQERDRYCSQQAYLLDVLLLAPSTLGKSLDRQLELKQPISVLASADLIRQLKKRNEDAFHRLCHGMTTNQISLVGGLDKERPHAYLSSSSIVRDIAHGLRAYSELGCPIPKTFSRYGAGFLSTTPTWLTHFAFSGAMLNAWSEGSVPDKDQAKIRWQSSNEGKSVDTIIGHVMDASSADTYIDLADQLAKQLDYHHVPTVVLAHWPVDPILPQEDLQRVVARSPALGKFHTVDNYFTTTNQPYSSDSFSSSEFRGPLPTGAPAQNKLHFAIRNYERHRVEVERLQSLLYLWIQVASQSPDRTAELANLHAKVDTLIEQLDTWFDNTIEPANMDGQIAECREQLLHQIRLVLDGTSAPSGKALIVNPSNHAQRLFLNNIDGTVEPSSSTRIYATETHGNVSRMVVDIPPYGFVRYQTNGPSEGTAISHSQNTPVKSSFWNKLSGRRSGVAESDLTLSNEFMEVQIDPKKGHLRSIYVANKRGSRLSGMPSIVEGPADSQGKWDDSNCVPLSNLVIKVIHSSTLVGTIEVSGEAKLSDGSTAKMTTRYTLWKGARWLDIDIQAENVRSERLSCVWRTAWLNEGATVSAWQQGIKGKLPSALQSSVELIEIDEVENRIYFAPRGLSAHRRSDSRFLISYLPSTPEGKVVARFSLGLDWPRPYETASDFSDRPWMLSPSSTNTSNRGSSEPDQGAWLAQCSLPFVNLSFADPNPTLPSDCFPEDQASVWEGHTGDLCVWVRETQGKSGMGKLSFFRDVAEAWRVDFQNREFDTLSIQDGQISINIRAHEQSRILIRWKAGKGPNSMNEASSELASPASAEPKAL